MTGARAERTRALKARARALGFDRVGIARAGPAPDGGRFLAWLEAGRHGGMPSLAHRVERRLDPRRVVPGARSIVVVARAYPAQPEPARDPRRARIARFARGRDYHRSVAADLRRLAAGLRGRARVCVDAGPVLERSWARAAGVAWIGRNTCAIAPGLGSYIVLGALIATEAFEPDPPLERDGCGGCDLCLGACPSGALIEPGILDARLCLSYATIEAREIPAADRRAIRANRLYGCDTCQEACPWNRERGDDGHPDLAPRPAWRAPMLEELAGLGEAAFLERARGTTIRRLGYGRFLRNLLVGIGNAGDPALAAALEGIAGRPAVRREPSLGELAAWAADRIARVG